MIVSFRTSMRLKRLVKVLLALVALTLAGLLIWLLWLDRYVVYGRERVWLDFSRSSRDLVGEVVEEKEPEPPISIYYNEGDNLLMTNTEMVRLSGYYVDASMLSKDFDGVVNTIRRLPPGTPVMLEVKDDKGRFFYNTGLGENHKSIDPNKMDALIRELCSGDLYAIARFPAYKEYLYPLENVNHGLSSTKGPYLYWDPDRCYWLNPANNGAMAFLMSEITEVKNLGFDEIVLADFRFPNTNEIIFKGDKTETLNTVAKTLSDTYGSEHFVLSFEVTDTAFQLPAERCRIYKIGFLAEQVKKVAEETGLENPEIQVVFTTELLDTRFDAYGVMRPITSARIED